jgi:uncharacterized paraquat-inducible protein A
MKSTLIFIVFVLIVIGFLCTVSGKRVPPPLIPADAAHQAVTEEKACMDCHAFGKAAPMKKSHPPKRECFKCHKTVKRNA